LPSYNLLDIIYLWNLVKNGCISEVFNLGKKHALFREKYKPIGSDSKKNLNVYSWKRKFITTFGLFY